MSGWAWLDRYHVCFNEPVWADLYSVPDGALLGEADFIVVIVSTLQKEIRRWQTELFVNMWNATGQMQTGTNIDAFFQFDSCLVSATENSAQGFEIPAECKIRSEFPPPEGAIPIGLNQPKYGWWVFSADETTDFVWPTTSWTLQVGNQATTYRALWNQPLWLGVRCDTAPYFGFAQGGCVAAYAPAVFELSISDPTVAQAAAFYRDAQLQLPHDGYYVGPGRYVPVDDPLENGAWGPLNPLTRAFNPDIRRLNNDTACAGFIPEHAGEECDEYPFASTNQGAAFGSYMVRSIPGDQNGKAGSLLSAFYQENHVIDGDEFSVWIKP